MAIDFDGLTSKIEDTTADLSVTTQVTILAWVLADGQGEGNFGRIISIAIWGLVNTNLDAAVLSRATPAQVNTEVLDVVTVDRFADLDAAVSSRATPAQVNTEVLDVVTVDTFAEVAAVPAATSTLKDKINWLFALARNKLTQTSTTQTLRNGRPGVLLVLPGGQEALSALYWCIALVGQTAKNADKRAK